MQHLFVECAVRAALIALGTAAVLRALRVKSAGARHAAWSGVVALMLVLPVWMAWGPRASWRVLPAAPAPAAAVPIGFSTPWPAAEVHSADLVLDLAVDRAAVALAATLGAPPAARSARWNWLAAVYLSGVFILLLRLALGTLRAHALVRRATRYGGRLTSPLCAAPVTRARLSPSLWWTVSRLWA